MKRVNILLAACMLAGMCHTARAQENKTGNGERVQKTVTMELKSPEDLQKLFGSVFGIGQQDSASATKPKAKMTVKPLDNNRPDWESNNGKQLWAKSYLNLQAPKLVVDKWLTEEPDTEGKFMLIDFWGTACAPCKKSIPDLNAFSKQFADKLVVIGVCVNKEKLVRAMKTPVIEYYSAIDTSKTYIDKFEIKGYPHAILVDTRGKVRWEGNPLLKGHELTAEVIAGLLEKYNYENGGISRDRAKPFVGEKAPDWNVKEWHPAAPDTKGKFVLRDFFGYHCGSCREAIPKLNKWQKEFADDLVIIGCGRESVERLRTIKPQIEYTLATVPQEDIWNTMELHVLSYVQLIDPKGIVRWEGQCLDLTTAKIREIIEKYK